jgi:pectate lyase
MRLNHAFGEMAGFAFCCGSSAACTIGGLEDEVVIAASGRRMSACGWSVKVGFWRVGNDVVVIRVFISGGS